MFFPFLLEPEHTETAARIGMMLQGYLKQLS